MSAETPALCMNCDKLSTSHCGQCKGVRYCSTECQKSDWPVHKLLCSTFATFDTSNRPTSEHVRAILFPEQGTKPEFVWGLLNRGLGDDMREEYVEYQPYMGDDHPARILLITDNTVLGAELKDTIHVWYRDRYMSDGSVANSSIASITAVKPGRYWHFRGPYLAYCTKGTPADGDDGEICRDITMEDFRHIADFFFTYTERMHAKRDLGSLLNLPFESVRPRR